MNTLFFFLLKIKLLLGDILSSASPDAFDCRPMTSTSHNVTVRLSMDEQTMLAIPLFALRALCGKNVAWESMKASYIANAKHCLSNLRHIANDKSLSVLAMVLARPQSTRPLVHCRLLKIHVSVQNTEICKQK